MNTYRKIAIVAGIFIIVGMITGFACTVSSSILNNTDYLIKIPENEGRIISGAILVLIRGLALAMASLLIYQVVKKQNTILAGAYLILRGILETFTYILISICWLLLLSLGLEFAKTEHPDVPTFQIIGNILLKAAHWSTLNTVIIFSLGLIILYYLLFRSELVPRWISTWGICIITVHLGFDIFLLFGHASAHSVTHDVLHILLFLQDIVFALWLIAKGFDRSAVASILNNRNK